MAGITKKKNEFYDLNSKISKAIRTLKELSNLNQEVAKTADSEEKRLIESQIQSLEKSFKETVRGIGVILNRLSLVAPLKKKGVGRPVFKPLARQTLMPKVTSRAVKPSPIGIKPLPMQTEERVESKEKELDIFEEKRVEDVEKETIKRLREFREKRKAGKKKKVRKRTGANPYIRLSNKMFSGLSEKLLKKGHFKGLKRTLNKANMRFLTKSYVSFIFFTTLISMFVSLGLFVFFLFFNFGVTFPFITLARTNVIDRALNIFWFFLLIPVITYFGCYVYPSLEKKSIETKIAQELPFATIHMASIAESMIEPSNIFHIMTRSPDYPTLRNEFTKLINEINVFGRDLVTALRNSSFNSPSKKLAELFDGLATTITSGGDLSNFFEKRSQSLLFDYRLDKEKRTKAAETFMDIYISVVIAAPMILMLLLIMMRVSGLGISLSAAMISLVMVAGVSFINVVFLVFLHLRSPEGG